MLINSLAIANEEAPTTAAAQVAGHDHTEWNVDKVAADSTEMKSASDHHALVHPFLVHMGMPDGPGELSVRIFSVEERNAGVANGTYGFHFEAGLFDRLGLHLRNDAIRTHSNTEMMLQYAILRSADGKSGISVIGEVEFPTGNTLENRSTGMFGISFAYLWLPTFAVNSVVHYDQDEKMLEWEISFIGRLTEKIFPVLELSGETGDIMSLSTALFAWKFKIPNNNSLGVAYRVPISTMREFESQLMLQAEFNFH